MRSGRVVLWSLLFLFCGCKFEGSCGNNDNLLNTRKGEKVLGEWLEKQSLLAESITCPSGIEMKAGTNFICKALIAESKGLEIELRVHQTSDTGDIRMEHASDVQTAERVERGLAGRILDETGKKVGVDCGARLRFAVPGTKFRCSIIEERLGANRSEVAPESYEMEITIKDTRGDWQARRL
ncbi:MAG: hypothetical protein GY811_00155 [Myxococcales bacterium]|nr:hypothetical protein [Myxococcales bacterium]